MDDLDEVADRLYALAPEDFTAARDAAAKQAGDKKAVKALRRPSVSAWVVNLLAREQADLLRQLLDLGPALAEAQRDGQGDALRTLGQQRRELVGAVTATAVGLPDRTVSAQVRAEVQQTLEAALADPRAADAVRSGRLVRPLSYAGFGDVDLDDAVAVQPPRRARKPTAEQRTAPDVDALERAALDAAATLDDAVRACEQAERARTAAQQQRDDRRDDARRAQQEAQRLEQQLAAARTAAAEARDAADAAERDAEQAEGDAERRRREVIEAQDAAERARAELDCARREG